MGVHMRCPVSGASVQWGEEWGEDIPQLHLDLAERYRIEIIEVYNMAHEYLQLVDADYATQCELILELRQQEQWRDTSLLQWKGRSLADVVQVWERSVEALRWVAQHRPEKAAEIEQLIQASREKLILLRERLRLREAS
jgi:hypothetical protein